MLRSSRASHSERGNAALGARRDDDSSKSDASHSYRGWLVGVVSIVFGLFALYVCVSVATTRQRTTRMDSVAHPIVNTARLRSRVSIATTPPADAPPVVWPQATLRGVSTSRSTPELVPVPMAARSSAATKQPPRPPQQADAPGSAQEPAPPPSPPSAPAPPAPAQVEVPPQAPRFQRSELLSLGRPATADVRGNLGPASVVTSPDVGDWLKDRWQAAVDMTGRPIRGSHWVEVDLGRPCVVARVVLDWEVAYASQYVVQGRLGSSGPWADIVTHKAAVVSTKRRFSHPKQAKKHVVHTLDVPSASARPAAGVTAPTAAADPPAVEIDTSATSAVRYVRVVTKRNGSQWGVSLWRFEVYGVEVAQTT